MLITPHSWPGTPLLSPIIPRSSPFTHHSAPRGRYTRGMAPEKSAWYAFVRWAVRTFYFGLVTGGMRSVGEENIPRTGGVIVAPNHTSNLDPPVTSCGTKRPIAFMAKEELFKGIFGKIIASLGAFPVRRGETDTESIR